MGSRYMVSGVQLGMLRGLAENGDDIEVEKLLKKIGQHQHIQDSVEPLEKDIKNLRNFIEEIE